MTTSTISVMHCDFAGCIAQAPDESRGYVADRPDGWTDAIYTHGCPDHGGAIAAHKATKTSRENGQGRRRATYWYLTCACGWTPDRSAKWNSEGLHAAHLAHVAAVTAAHQAQLAQNTEVS
jgi:hypothetical protein